MHREKPDVAFQRAVREALDRAGVVGAEKSQVLRSLAESGVQLGYGDPLALGEEVRSQVVADRIERRSARASDTLLQQTEQLIGRSIGPNALHDLEAAIDRLIDSVLDAASIALEDGQLLSKAALAGLLSTADEGVPPVLVIPGESGCYLLRWGALLGFHGALLTVARTWLKTWLESMEEIALASLLENADEGHPSEDAGLMTALQQHVDQLVRRQEQATVDRAVRILEVLYDRRDDAVLIAAIGGLQESAVLVFGDPLFEGRLWREEASVLSRSSPSARPWECHVEEPPVRIIFAALALYRVLGLEPPETIEAPAVRVRIASDLDRNPYGLRISVNDPWVSRSAVRSAVDQGLRDLQRATRDPNLSLEDTKFLDLVNEERRQWMDEGRWDTRTRNDRSPYGFWNSVRDRWNVEYPDQQRQAGSLRVWHHRLQKKSETAKTTEDRQ
jgi:hypothetical protein